MEVNRITMENKGGYAFVVNVLDVQVDLPISITPTLRLEAATEQQIAEIKRLLVLGGLALEFYYEHEWTMLEASEIKTRHEARELPRNRWRYYVVSWAGLPEELATLRKGANLVPPGILCYSEVYTSEEFGKGQQMGRKFESVSVPESYFSIPIKALPVDTEIVEEWRGALTAFSKLDKAIHPGISRAVDTLEHFNRLPLSVELRVLGYFMVLEMLLTHNPNDKELGDSLSHQICSKVALLQSRLRQPLDYWIFGKGVDPNKIWKRLYGFRSAIAHGGSPDFKNELKVLKTPQVATEFLKDATALILRHALDEPVLFDSLKPV